MVHADAGQRQALAKCPLQPSLYLRFLDDIIGIWTHGKDTFETFKNILNNRYQSIKIKHTIDCNSVNFLDTTISFTPSDATHNKIISMVCFKPTDTHALLHKHSYHPRHTFRGIIKSQILRFHRICSLNSDFHQAVSILFSSLRKRHYSDRFLCRIKSQTLATLVPPHLHLVDRDAPSSPQPTHRWMNHLVNSPHTAPVRSPPKLTPFITTFSHRYNELHHLFKSNFDHRTSQNPALQNHTVISALRKNASLRDLLVTATFSTESPTTGTHQKQLLNQNISLTHTANMARQ